MLVQARTLLSALLLAALLLTPGPVAADDGGSGPASRATSLGVSNAPAVLGSYTPVAGAIFNDPTAGKWARGRIINHIIKTINSSPPGSTIRMAVFSFAHPEVSDALVEAYLRGVRLKLVFAGENIYSPMLRLQRLVGSDPNGQSFAIICANSCRGTKGQMHAKYFSFRRAGTAKLITMVGSVNLTRYNADRQWNDIYTSVGDRDFFRSFGVWFNQLKKDLPVEPTYMVKTTPQAEVTFTPLDPLITPDPIYGLMSRVRCLVPSEEIDPLTPTPGVLVPTQVMIAAHAWNGARGRLLATKTAELAAAGCVARVVLGVGYGPYVKDILVAAGIPISVGTHPGIRTHQKLLIISGGFDADPQTTRVVTGSSNWSDLALNRDDMVVTINDEAVGAQYVAGFEHMWLYG